MSVCCKSIKNNGGVRQKETERRKTNGNNFFGRLIESARARNVCLKDKGIYFDEKPDKTVEIFVKKTVKKCGTFARKGLSDGDGCDKVNGTGGIDMERN